MKKPGGSQPLLTAEEKLVIRPHDPLHADEFDTLVRALIPTLRALLPDLSDVETLRAAARMAEYRLSDERTLMGVDFRD